MTHALPTPEEQPRGVGGLTTMRASTDDLVEGKEGAFLAGIWGFAPTPFTKNGPDLSALEEIAARVADGNPAAVVANGLIAQGDVMNSAERQMCLDAVRRGVAGRCPIVATVFELADFQGVVVGDSAGALLVVPSSAHVTDLVPILEAARHVTSAPLLVYHRPPLVLEPDDVHALLSQPQVVGMKDGYGDMRRFRQLRLTAPAWVWIAAHEDLALPYWAMGADGFCPISAIYAPHYTTSWWSALKMGDVRRCARILERHAYGVADLRHGRPDVDIAIVKAAMQAQGMPIGMSRPPVVQPTDHELTQLTTLMQEVRQTTCQGEASQAGKVAT
jgi:5-dehydro-4-deoxyglucarate dehydratase